jgi:hypothetical protein
MIYNKKVAERSNRINAELEKTGIFVVRCCDICGRVKFITEFEKLTHICKDCYLLSLLEPRPLFFP